MLVVLDEQSLFCEIEVLNQQMAGAPGWCLCANGTAGNANPISPDDDTGSWLWFPRGANAHNRRADGFAGIVFDAPEAWEKNTFNFYVVSVIWLFFTNKIISTPKCG